MEMELLILEKRKVFSKESDNLVQNLRKYLQLIKKLSRATLDVDTNAEYEKIGDSELLSKTTMSVLDNAAYMFKLYNAKIQEFCRNINAVGDTMELFSCPKSNLVPYQPNTMGECVVVDAENLPDGHCFINDLKIPELPLHLQRRQNLKQFPEKGQVFAVSVGANGLYRAVYNDLIFEAKKKVKLYLIDIGKRISIPFDLKRFFLLSDEMQRAGSRAIQCKVLEICDQKGRTLRKDIGIKLQQILNVPAYFHINAIEDKTLRISIYLKDALEIPRRPPLRIKTEIIDLTKNGIFALERELQHNTAIVHSTTNEMENELIEDLVSINNDYEYIDVNGDADDNAIIPELDQKLNSVLETSLQNVTSNKHSKLNASNATTTATATATAAASASNEHKRSNKANACLLCTTSPGHCSLKRRKSVHVAASTYTTHASEKPYKCEICDKRFASAKYLAHHESTHDIVCKICSIQFDKIVDLEKHVRLKHPGHSVFVCHICGKMLASVSSWKWHQNLHDKKKIYTCELCDKVFYSPSSIYTHSVHHHKKPR